MAKRSKTECIATARAALGHFDDDQLYEYAVKVLREMKESGLPSDAAMKKIGEEELKLMYNHAAITAKNIAKFEDLANEIRTKKGDHASLLIKRYKTLGKNVEGSQSHAKEKLNSALFDNMTDEQHAYLRDSNNRQEIFDALDGKDVSTTAKELAKHIENYRIYRNAEMVNSTALSIERINQNRFLGNTHNSAKILKAGRNGVMAAMSKAKYSLDQVKERWRTKIKSHLDLDKTFEDTKAINLEGDINHSKIDEIVDNTFENITTGRNEIFTKSLVANDREAMARKKQMFYVFKDWSNWGAYDSEYGIGDLYSALVHDIEVSGNKIGVAEILGDSPYNMHLDLRKVQKETGYPKVISPNLWDRNVDLYFQEVMGATRTAASPTFANMMANIRSITSMSRLAKLSIMSLPDVGRLAAFANRWGDSYWSSFGHDLAHTFNTFKTEDRIEVAKSMKFALKSEFGFIGRYVDAANVSQALQKFSGAYYRTLGVNALDTGRKVSAMTLMAKRLGKNSGKSWDELNPALQEQLGKFIDEHEWELIRKYKNPRGNLITYDSVKSITNKELAKLKEDRKSNLPLSEIRNDIERKAFSLFDIAAEQAVLTPGAFERAWLYQGTQPGSVSGEIMRLIGQFKSFPLAGIDRVYAQRFLDKDSAGSKLMWATQMLAATTGMNYLINFFDYASQGLSMPDRNEMTFGQRTRYDLSMIESSFAVFYKALDPKEQQSDLIATLFNGPSLRLMSDVISSILGMPQGNTKPLKKVANDLLPISGVPLISPLMDEIFGSEPYMQPGQHKLY